MRLWNVKKSIRNRSEGNWKRLHLLGVSDSLQILSKIQNLTKWDTKLTITISILNYLLSTPIFSSHWRTFKKIKTGNYEFLWCSKICQAAVSCNWLWAASARSWSENWRCATEFHRWKIKGRTTLGWWFWLPKVHIFTEDSHEIDVSQPTLDPSKIVLLVPKDWKKEVPVASSKLAQKMLDTFQDDFPIQNPGNFAILVYTIPLTANQAWISLLWTWWPSLFIPQGNWKRPLGKWKAPTNLQFWIRGAMFLFGGV